MNLLIITSPPKEIYLPRTHSSVHSTRIFAHLLECQLTNQSTKRAAPTIYQGHCGMRYWSCQLTMVAYRCHSERRRERERLTRCSDKQMNMCQREVLQMTFGVGGCRCRRHFCQRDLISPSFIYFKSNSETSFYICGLVGWLMVEVVNSRSKEEKTNLLWVE